MINICAILRSIKSELSKLQIESERAEEYCMYGNFKRFANKAEVCLRASSDIFLMYREILLTFYELSPSLSKYIDLEEIECLAMHISIEEIDRPNHSYLKITLPFLLPNKRQRKTDYNNALTHTIREAAIRFRNEKIFYPFSHAAVFIVSYCDNPVTMVDNDNKECSVLINSLCGLFLRDDCPSACDTFFLHRYSEEAPKTEVYIADHTKEIEVLTLIKQSQTDALTLSHSD